MDRRTPRCHSCRSIFRRHHPYLLRSRKGLRYILSCSKAYSEATLDVHATKHNSPAVLFQTDEFESCVEYAKLQVTACVPAEPESASRTVDNQIPPPPVVMMQTLKNHIAVDRALISDHSTLCPMTSILINRTLWDNTIQAPPVGTDWEPA